MSLKRFAAMVLLTICWSSGTAWGEVGLVQSIPVNGAVLAHAPGTITLSFDAPIDPTKTRLFFSEVGGRFTPPLPRQRFGSVPTDHLTVVMPILSKGAYVLRFKVVGIDGSSAHGRVSFTAGGY